LIFFKVNDVSAFVATRAPLHGVVKRASFVNSSQVLIGSTAAQQEIISSSRD
jgi:hypothetical protein|tara:strand:+ start:4124 stop:4279 length:156 start_codon:yes stop_codon:yes gene_type:complete